MQNPNMKGALPKSFPREASIEGMRQVGAFCEKLFESPSLVRREVGPKPSKGWNVLDQRIMLYFDIYGSVRWYLFVRELIFDMLKQLVALF